MTTENMTRSWTIDLASDTATKPSAAMLAAMAAADVGDEQRGEDRTTTALCERVADLLGMEAAVFLPSGTMCNQIAFLVHCRPGDEIVTAANAHVFSSEGAGAAALAGAQFSTIATANGLFSAEDVRAALRKPRHRSPRSRVVSVEQTSNRGGGTVWPLAKLADIRDVALSHGLLAHMDGARLPNAAVASGRPMHEHSRGYDSAWIDLSKGLGCPVGAVLAGSKGFIEEAWYWKHRLGGAMRQSGYLAAAGLFALEHNYERLALDHQNARLLAELVNGAGGAAVSPNAVETNILFIDLSNCAIDADTVAERLSEHGIRLGVENPRRMRAVTHLDVDTGQIREAASRLAGILTTG